MFEKEAHEQANKKYPIPFNWNEIDCVSRNKYEEGFKDGAEFGYNKANEWHDLRENNNDLPKENMKQVMVMTNYNECLMGWYSYYDKDWWDNDCPDPQDRIETDGTKVVMWKEIVLPELKESE